MPTIDRRILAAALLLVSSAATAHRASAQEAPSSPSGGGAGTAAVDTLPFRAGQWGADFAINNGAAGLGVLRFRSPRMAWVLNATIDADWRSVDVTNPPDGLPYQDVDGSSLALGLRAGPRWYRPVTAGVAAYVGTGVTSQIVRSNADRQDVVQTRGWNVGGFGDVGAAYFVTRRLSLGAQTGVFLTYGEMTYSADVPQYERKDQTTRIEVTPVRILGALYF